MLLSINIYKRDTEKYDKDGNVSKDCHNIGSFFLQSNRLNAEGQPLLLLNTDIWNNKNILNLTGYDIEELSMPLYDLAVFIKKNL